MKMTKQNKAERLERNLPLIKGLDFDDNNELVDVNIQPTTFISDDGVLHISGECGDGLVDYYGEYRGGYPYIHPILVKWAEKKGMYWEWDNPGSIGLYE